MKKRLIFTGLLALLFAACCFAQKPYKVVFYNLENFFDTINDPEVNDDEFTPEGPKKWNSVKYAKKLGNTEKVLFDIAGIDKDYPIVIGVSRKSFIARLSRGEPPQERIAGSLAAALFAVGRGAHILRVHDVAQTRQALSVWRALAGGA